MQVSMIVASTLDGFIAQKSAQSSLDWTSRADKIFFTQTSKAARFLVVGAKTFHTFNFEKITKNRVIIVLTSQPEKITAANLRWNDLHADLESGIVAVKMAAAALVHALAEKDIPQLLVCGGANVYRQFWQTGLVSKLYLTLEPIFFGDGISLGSAINIDNKLQKLSAQNWQQLPNSDTMVVTLSALNN